MIDNYNILIYNLNIVMIFFKFKWYIFSMKKRLMFRFFIGYEYVFLCVYIKKYLKKRWIWLEWKEILVFSYVVIEDCIFGICVYMLFICVLGRI